MRHGQDPLGRCTPIDHSDGALARPEHPLEYAAKPEAERYYQSFSSWPDGMRGEPAR